MAWAKVVFQKIIFFVARVAFFILSRALLNCKPKIQLNSWVTNLEFIIFLGLQTIYLLYNLTQND